MEAIGTHSTIFGKILVSDGSKTMPSRLKNCWFGLGVRRVISENNGSYRRAYHQKSNIWGTSLLTMGRETKGCVINVSERSERRRRNIFRQVRDVPIL